MMDELFHLSRWSGIVYRAPASYYFHEQNSKAVDIIRFVKHAGTCIVRADISVVIRETFVRQKKVIVCAS